MGWDTKQWYKSKTLWVNVLAIGGALLTALSGELATAGTLGLVAVVNIMLRLVTKSGIERG